MSCFIAVRAPSSRCSSLLGSPSWESTSAVISLTKRFRASVIGCLDFHVPRLDFASVLTQRRRRRIDRHSSPAQSYRRAKSLSQRAVWQSQRLHPTHVVDLRICESSGVVIDRSMRHTRLCKCTQPVRGTCLAELRLENLL